MFRPFVLLSAAMSIAAPSAAVAAIINYRADLQTLNSLEQVQAGNGGAPISPDFVGSTISGYFLFTLDTELQSLRVRIEASGLETGIAHFSRVHGRLVDNTMPGSGALDSTIPTLADDADGDGFIEVAEGTPAYGPVVFDFGNIGETSEISFDMTYDLTAADAPFGPVSRFDPDGPKFGIADLLGDDLMSLQLRHVVIHGLSVPFEMGIAGAAPNEVDGSSTLNAVSPQDNTGPGGVLDPFEGTIFLPAANGDIELVQVPEPAMLGLFGLGVMALGFRRRQHATKR